MQSGHGRIRVGRDFWQVHRLVWVRCNGRIPAGRVVRHICNVPNCINVMHLALGTQADNIEDRDRSGNTARGERHGRTTITADQAIEIFKGTDSLRQAAKRFGVGQSTIDRIRRGVTWGHVTRPGAG